MAETAAPVSGQSSNLQSLLEDSLYSYGYELVCMELTGRDKNRVLRLFIDAPGGISVDDCVFVSRQIGRLLDVEDPIAGNYILEVSSPGIERPLVKQEHFENVVDQNIEVATMKKIEGRRNFLGQLTRVENGVIEMRVDGYSYAIELNSIRRARLKPDL